jgi:hypothetical protein
MVKNLNLWGNDLEDIRLLRQMPNVEVLSLSVNKIASLKEFANCNKLQELYLRKNNIADLSEIRHLTNLPNLRVLWLWDNPCAEIPNYREIVIKVLPNLGKLDNTAITPEEKSAASKITVNLEDFRIVKEDLNDSPPQVNDRRGGNALQDNYVSGGPIGGGARNNNNVYSSIEASNAREYMSQQPSIEPKEMGVYNRKDSKIQEYNQRQPSSEYQRQPSNDYGKIGGGQTPQNLVKEKPLPKRDPYQGGMYGESPSKSVLQENPSYGDSPSHHRDRENREKERDILSSLPQKTNSQSNDNIMSAVLLLVRELDERYLELVKREVDKRLTTLKNK